MILVGLTVVYVVVVVVVETHRCVDALSSGATGDAWDAETTTANRSDALASCTEPMHTVIMREIKVISSVDGHTYSGVVVGDVCKVFGRCNMRDELEGTVRKKLLVQYISIHLEVRILI